MTTITFDIETVPAQAPWVREELLAAVKAPGTFKKPESIAQWLAENREAEAEDAWLKTSFDGGLGQIVCIGFAINDDAPTSYIAPDLSLAAERKLIEDFFCVLLDAYGGGHGLKPLLVGHNHVAFDIPFIWKRAVVHGIKPPLWFPRNPKPWSEIVFDTMTQWVGDRDRVSMDRLCKILGIPGKDGMSGDKVWPAIQRGEFDRVASYCRDDVSRTRAMWRRMTFLAAPVESAARAEVSAPAAPAPAAPAVDMDAPWALPAAPADILQPTF